MLYNLLTKFKSNKVKFANFYENQFYEKRFLPLQILQIGCDATIPVWQKFMPRSNIFCIDNFQKQEPKNIDYLKESRIYWIRCDIDNEKAVKKIMKEQWNSPRFNIIIDNNIDRYDIFRKYCVGKYYVENKDNVRII